MPNGRPPKYPWNVWFSQAEGQTLSAGMQVPSHINFKSLRSQAYVQAKKRGFRISFEINEATRSAFLRTVRNSALDDYFDGETHVVLPSDIPGEPHSLMTSIMREAWKRGLEDRMLVNVADGGQVVCRLKPSGLPA